MGDSSRQYYPRKLYHFTTADDAAEGLLATIEVDYDISFHIPQSDPVSLTKTNLKPTFTARNTAALDTDNMCLLASVNAVGDGTDVEPHLAVTGGSIVDPRSILAGTYTEDSGVIVTDNRGRQVPPGTPLFSRAASGRGNAGDAAG